jgi:hypothetical protein
MGAGRAVVTRVLPAESEAASSEETPAEARPAVETGAEAAPRTLPIEEVLALPVVPPLAPLDPRARCLRLHGHPPAVSPRRTRQRSLSLASHFLAGRPVQCDGPDALAANQ